MKKILFLLILPIICFSQMRMMGPTPFALPSERFFYEALSVPSESGKSRILTTVKIPYEFLVFTKSPERTSKDFIGSFDVSIEIFDKEGNYLDRRIKQEIIELNTDERKATRDKFFETSFTFEVEPGEYKINFELSDRESQKSVKREIKKFTAKDFKSPSISDILFSQSDNGIKGDRNLTGGIPFGENSIIQAKITGIEPAVNKIKFTLTKIIEKKREIVLSTEMNPDHFIKENNISSLSFPFRSDTLEISRYEALLETELSGKKISSKKDFEIIWYKMPFSLRDFDMAQSQLKLILSEDEFKQLRSGSKFEQREKFLDFWRKKDPTPNTAYNEIMTEFFRRVDFAIMNYSSVSNPDGSQTDRGKQYILFGKPDNIERKLIPNEAPLEIWTYQKLNKKYIFVDNSRQGNYILSSVENL